MGYWLLRVSGKWLLVMGYWLLRVNGKWLLVMD